MFRSGFQISTDEQLAAVLHNQTPIQAWQDGQALHHGSPVESFTRDTVKIDGHYFMRSSCIFKVR